MFIERVFEKLMGSGKICEYYDVKPPDLICKQGSRYIVVRYLIGEEVDYSLRELDLSKLKDLVSSFSELLELLPPRSEIKIIKKELDLNRLLSKISNELMNLRASIDVVEEPHIKKKAEIKLRILESLYENIVKGKPVYRLTFVVKIYSENTNLSSAISYVNTMSERLVVFLKSTLGINLKKASKKEVLEILRYEFGLKTIPDAKSIIIDNSRASTLLPIPKYKKPSFETREGIPIGIDLETGWPVILPLDILNKHVVIIGPTGRGKTTLLATIIEGLISLSNIHVFSIDFKGDLANLINNIIEYQVTPFEFPINLLYVPPIFNTVEWSIAVADALSHVLGIDYDTIVNSISKAVINREKYVSVKNVLLDKDLAILSPLVELLTEKPRYEVFDKYIKGPTVFNLGGYGTAFQNVYGGIIIYLYNKFVSTKKDNQFRVLVIDEAWRISKLKVIEALAKEGRSRRIGLIMATQNPSDIPREVIENTHTLIMFGSPNEDYIRDAKRFLGLPNSVLNKLYYLGIGEALMFNALDPHPIILKVRCPVSMKTNVLR